MSRAMEFIGEDTMEKVSFRERTLSPGAVATAPDIKINSSDKKNTLVVSAHYLSFDTCPTDILHVPNETTLAAMRELEEGGGDRFATLEDMFAAYEL